MTALDGHSPDIQRRSYALTALMKAADDRPSKGTGTGEFTYDIGAQIGVITSQTASER